MGEKRIHYISFPKSSQPSKYVKGSMHFQNKPIRGTKIRNQQTINSKLRKTIIRKGPRRIKISRLFIHNTPPQTLSLLFWVGVLWINLDEFWLLTSFLSLLSSLFVLFLYRAYCPSCLHIGVISGSYMCLKKSLSLKRTKI